MLDGNLIVGLTGLNSKFAKEKEHNLLIFSRKRWAQLSLIGDCIFMIYGCDYISQDAQVYKLLMLAFQTSFFLKLQRANTQELLFNIHIFIKHVKSVEGIRSIVSPSALMIYLKYSYLNKSMFSDQLQQCKGSFRAEKDHFDVTFLLETNDENSFLLIQLKNRHTHEIYRTKIDQQYIKVKNQLSFCFQTPEELFYTLMELFPEIMIEDQSTICFEMKLNATKLKKKIIKIRLQKWQIEESKMIQIKLDTLQKEFKKQAMIKDQKIKLLTKSNQQHEQTITILKQEIGQIKKDQETLFLQNKRQQFKISSLIKENQMQRKEVGTLQKNLQYFLTKLNTLQIYSFFENPDWHHFGIVKLQSSFKIVRKDCDGVWHSFVYNTPLKAGKVNGFRIKQVKTCYKNIMYGIGTMDIFGVSNSYKEKQSIAYNSYSGNIWQNGSSRKSGMPIYDGQVVSLDVSLANFKITWHVEGKKVGQTYIPEQMRQKQLFLVLHFYNVEDEVQLFLF